MKLICIKPSSPHHDQSQTTITRPVAMFFKLILFHQLVALTLANPFHKYPYVFLLDVGNEALENINTEKIRLSVPGGSVALKYPAVGDGGTIIHVRVSGIDFGTDLKASIVEGGPGYNYVVLMFAGNSGVPYEAVVTVGTLRSDMSEGVQETGEQTGSNDSSVITDKSGEVNSGDEVNYVNSNKKTPTQETNANIYNYQSNYAENEVENEAESKDTQVNEKEDYYNERPVDISNGGQNALNNEYIPNDKSYDGEKPRDENTNVYAQPQYNDFRPQSSEQSDQQEGTVDDVKTQENTDPSVEEQSEIDQMFNDEETHNNDSANKLQDANNNYAYADEQPAVDS